MDRTKEKLGNTRAVCRKYYIHPVLIESYLDGIVMPPMPERGTWNERRNEPGMLRRHELDTLAFLRERIAAKKSGTDQG